MEIMFPHGGNNSRLRRATSYSVWSSPPLPVRSGNCTLEYQLESAASLASRFLFAFYGQADGRERGRCGRARRVACLGSGGCRRSEGGFPPSPGHGSCGHLFTYVHRNSTKLKIRQPVSDTFTTDPDPCTSMAWINQPHNNEPPSTYHHLTSSADDRTT